jgi:hypothetical protein
MKCRYPTAVSKDTVMLSRVTCLGLLNLTPSDCVKQALELAGRKLFGEMIVEKYKRLFMG